MSPEHETMRELLQYPNTQGIHPSEVRWRDFARELIKEYEAELEQLHETLNSITFETKGQSDGNTKESN